MRLQARALLVAAIVTTLIAGSARAEVAIGPAGPPGARWTGTGEQQPRGVSVTIRRPAEVTDPGGAAVSPGQARKG